VNAEYDTGQTSRCLCVEGMHVWISGDTSMPIPDGARCHCGKARLNVQRSLDKSISENAAVWAALAEAQDER
jgi:hypothetical protein